MAISLQVLDLLVNTFLQETLGLGLRTLRQQQEIK